MPVAAQVEVPQRLCTTFAARVLSTSLVEPILPSRATSSAAAFDLQGVIVNLRDSSHDGAIPAVSVSSLCENARRSFQLGPLSASDFSATHIGLDDESFHSIRHPAPADVSEDAVEILELFCAILVTNHTTVLSENSKVKLFVHRR